MFPAAVGLLAVLPFLGALRHGFVSWDDADMILRNPLLLASWPEFLGSALTAKPLTAWQPLGWLLYRALGAPPSAGACHATALLLHGANAALAYRWLSADGTRRWGAAAAALLWAWHPVQTESVVWATMLSDLLCGLFVLLALHLRAGGKEKAASLAFFLAGLCRWKALAYPILCVLDDRIRPRARRSDHVTLAVLSVAVLAVHAWAKASAATVLAFRPHEAAAGLLWQSSKLIWPARLAPAAHLDGGDNPLGLGLAASLAIVSAGAWAAWRARKRSPALAYGLTAFALCLLPTLAATPTGPMFLHDHHLYLASLSLLPFAVPSLDRRARLVAPILLALGVMSHLQTRVWRDSDSLWSHALSLFPRSQYARVNWAADLVERGRPAEALILAEDQLALYPGDRDARLIREGISVRLGATPSARARLLSDTAGVHFERGERDRAAARMKEAVALAPKDPEILFNAAVVAAASGRREEARAFLKRALTSDPRHARAREAWQSLTHAPWRP